MRKTKPNSSPQSFCHCYVAIAELYSSRSRCKCLLERQVRQTSAFLERYIEFSNARRCCTRTRPCVACLRGRLHRTGGSAELSKMTALWRSNLRSRRNYFAQVSTIDQKTNEITSSFRAIARQPRSNLWGFLFPSTDPHDRCPS
jgi:hypothetical protein